MPSAARGSSSRTASGSSASMSDVSVARLRCAKIRGRIGVGVCVGVGVGVGVCHKRLSQLTHIDSTNTYNAEEHITKTQCTRTILVVLQITGTRVECTIDLTREHTFIVYCGARRAQKANVPITPLRMSPCPPHRCILSAAVHSTTARRASNYAYDYDQLKQSSTYSYAHIDIQ